MSRRGFLARLCSEATLAGLTLALGVELAVRAASPPDTSRAQVRSQLIASNSDENLWGFLAQDDKWRLSASQADVDPLYLDLLLKYEDHRFWNHRGVDVAALLRAGYQAIRYRRAVAGGSTLTMQVVRMLEPRPRTLESKIDQTLKAVKLERMLTKKDILDLYLTLAPFGGNIEGIRAAARIYLGKEPKRLSLAEAALLTALPQSPEARRPGRHLDTARVARNRVLSVLASRGVIASAAASRAQREPDDVRVRTLTKNAPHFARRVRQSSSDLNKDVIATLLDGDLQRQVEKIASRAIVHWGDAINIAIVVLRNQDASVAAYLGGVELAAESRKGFVDLVQAVRSPGSAFKPLIYAMAFEKLIVHPETIITDKAIDIDGYRPENADGQFAGDMSIRQALIRSRNTTAVKLLENLGVDALVARFRGTGRPLLLPTSEREAGLAIALGGMGVTLEQLTWFYTALANEGELKAIRLKPSDPVLSLGQFISAPAARATADILADVPFPPGYARQQAADGGRRIGFKTGTSYGFRDAWAIGFDQGHTVGVWVGRPDGAAHLGAYGATAAAPLLLQVFDSLPDPERDVAAGKADLGALTTYRELPKRLARFNDRGDELRRPPLEISFPRDGANIRIDRDGGTTAELPLVASGGTPPYRWIVYGVPQPASNVPVSKWPVDGAGQFDVSIVDATGTISKSSFWLE